MKLRPYSAYKDSGLPWLGRVPKHWNLLRAKYLMREMDTRSKDGSDTLLSVSQYSGVTKRRTRDGSEDPDTRSSSLVGYKVAKPGNLVSNIMLAWNGSLGIAPIEGVVSPAYCVYRICIGEPWFFHHLLRSPAYKAEIKRRSRGVVDSRLRLYTEDFFRIPMLLPNLKEQQAIVRFVRNLDRQVRRFIRNRRRLIKVLNEQKQAIINRAVTRGLDPNVSLKPSGIDWLGGIPEHWEVLKNKSVYSERRETGSEELPILSVSIHHGVSTEEQSEKENLRAKIRIQDREKYLRVYPNDIAFNMMRAWQGGIGVVRIHGMVSPAYIVAKPKRKIHSRFVELLFRTPQFVQEMDRNSRGITDFRKRLYWDQYKNISIVLPPIEEQQSIVNHIEKKVAPINKTISRTQREINLIREYRTRLISDVVTGNVDVRHLAPPPGSEDSEEMAEALEPLAEDTADAVIDDEERVNGPD